MIQFAQFGAGRIGAVHGRNIVRREDARLCALYDPQAAAAEHLAAEFGCPISPPDEIFANPEIDAILICSATDTHADLIEQSMATGKHVFCEKPIDLSLARVQSCLHRVAGYSARAMVAFNRRFDPHFEALQRRIGEGGIGTVEMISIISKDPAPPPIDYVRVSGGLFRDMTIHDFDMARFLLGEEIVNVSAQAACLVDPAIGEAGDVDSAAILLTSSSGKLVQISNSRRSGFGYDQRIEVLGSQGMLMADNIAENRVVEFSRNGVVSAKPVDFFIERYAQAYRLEIDAFIRCLQGENVTLPSLEDGLQALRVAEAAQLSLQQGRRVALAEIE